MHKSVMVAIAGVIAVLAFVAPTAVAGAAPGGAKVNTFTGTSIFHFDGVCPFAHQIYDASYGTRRHPGTLHMDGCGEPVGTPLAVEAVTPNAAGPTLTFAGTFTIEAPDGRVITGTVSGSGADSTYTGCPAGRVPTALSYVLTPTTGTRAVSGTRRPFNLEGVWCSGVNDQVDLFFGAFAHAPAIA